jgi:hypothetical protein
MSSFVYMTREQVYKAIDTEREYQRSLVNDPGRPDIRWDMHIGDHLTAIQYNLQQAINAWYKDSGSYPATMEYLRKIAGLCVQAGEIFGMPDRKEKVEYIVPAVGQPFDPSTVLKIVPDEHGK